MPLCDICFAPCRVRRAVGRAVGRVGHAVCRGGVGRVGRAMCRGGVGHVGRASVAYRRAVLWNSCSSHL